MNYLKTKLTALILVVGLIGLLVGFLWGRSIEPNGMDKTEIFFNEAERMGMFNCIEYKLDRNGVAIIHKINNDSTSTMSYYSRPIHLGTLAPGESKTIRLDANKNSN